MDAPYGKVLDTRNSNFEEEITIFFIANAEYPFLVTNGLYSFDCISWNDAKDHFDHFYSYNPPVGVVDRVKEYAA